MRRLALACVVLVGLGACGDGDNGAGAGELQGFICSEGGETYSVQEAAEKGYEVAHRGRCDDPMRCNAPEDCFVGDDCTSLSSDGVAVCVPGGCVCPAIFAPVCGSDGRTYGSRCEAVCVGVDVVRDGYCDDPPGEGCVRSGCSGQLCVEAGMDVASTCEWLPVYRCYQDATCERQPNGQCSFSPTRDLVECLEGFGECVCPAIDDPVCGVDGKSYSNACQAECAGVDIAHEGVCERCDGNCAPDEVCIGEQCIAIGCDGDHQCPPGERCVADDVCQFPPVVGDCDAAIPRWFFNSQSGECETFVWGGCGGNENRFETKETCESACPRQGAKWSILARAGRCESASCETNDECLAVCLADALLRPTIYDPVCGVDDQTYGNPCEAEVAGVEIAYVGECVDGGDCHELGCPTGFTCDTCMFAAESVRSVCLPPNAGACLPPASN